MVLKYILPNRRKATRPAPIVTLPRVAADERVYAVGDIHGRHDLLLRLLQKISADAVARADQRRVRIVFLGDYIDRGDHSREVIETLQKLGQGDPEGLTFLLGNHEAALLAFLADPVTHKNWLNFGAAQTLGSYGIVPPRPRAGDAALLDTRDALRAAMGRHIDFLEALKPMALSGQVVFAHAGLNPNRPLHQQRVNDLIWGHSEFLSPDPLPGYRVVHGHYDDVDPLVLPGRICVDTGAYYTGTLTAIRLDDGANLMPTAVTDPV